MGAIKCPDCGRKVSSDAAVCPHCGCPGDRIKKKSGCQTIIGLIVMAVIIIAMVMGNKDEKTSKSKESEEQTIEAVTNEVNETHDNELVYDNEYTNSSNSDNEEVAMHDEVTESPDFGQDEVSEIIATDNIENYNEMSED